MLEKLIIWCPSNDHLPFTKGKIVFEPFWNSFHFSIKCALLPTRGWTIKKVLNTATPWGGSFYLKISLICPYWFYALAFLSVFSFFCRRSGGDASSDTRPLAPPRPPYVWLRTKTNHQVNTPQRSWNFRLTRIVPDHVSKSSLFLVLLHHITPKPAVPSENNVRCSD